jgi:phosphoglucosamine mutase
LFGTDGIRGVANEWPMTPEIAFKVGAAVAYVVRNGTGRPPKILVGKDTRLSGYLLETALASGICSMGGKVLLSGPIPTPAVAYLTTSMRADAGIVISASHNAFEDNGIKIFGADGFKLADEKEAEIERFLDDPILTRARATGEHIGQAERVEAAGGRYITAVKGAFPRDLTLSGIKIVVDAAHGAAYRVAPLVFEELGADVEAICVSPDGTNINKKCGALHPENIRDVVVAQRAALGVSLDGDADRLIVVDERGQVVDGDVIMALCAHNLHKRGELRGGGVVATVMSNLGLERALGRRGLRLVRTAVGDRYVVEAMRAGGFSFGGEQSGHLIFMDHASTGDGLIAALQLLAVMLRENKPLSELAASAMNRVPQVLKNVTLAERRAIEDMANLFAAMNDVERKLGDEGRILVRWSGTEPKLRVMIEGPSQTEIEALANSLCEAAKKDIA